MQERPTGQLFQYVRASVDVKAKKDILHYSVKFKSSGGGRVVGEGPFSLSKLHVSVP